MDGNLPEGSADALGIDFESAEYGYVATEADEVESVEQAKEVEASHG